jgi:hypothetical protein
VRLPGSGGRYTGRSCATRPDSTRIDRVHPIRSAITVAGIIGYTANNSRIRGSTESAMDPFGGRTYFGGASDANAARTVFLATPRTRSPPVEVRRRRAAG